MREGRRTPPNEVRNRVQAGASGRRRLDYRINEIYEVINRRPAKRERPRQSRHRHHKRTDDICYRFFYFGKGTQNPSERSSESGSSEISVQVSERIERNWGCEECEPDRAKGSKANPIPSETKFQDSGFCERVSKAVAKLE